MNIFGRDRHQAKSKSLGRYRPVIWRTIFVPTVLAGLSSGTSIALLLDIFFVRPLIMGNPNIPKEFTTTLRILLTTLTMTPITFFMVLIAERSATAYTRLLESAQTLTDHAHDKVIDLNRTKNLSTVDVEIVASRLDQLEEKLIFAEQSEMLLQRYLGKEIAKHVLTNSNLPGGQMLKATVLFCDIRKFTKWMEQADVEELFEELNDYFTMIQSVIGKYGGVINKFGGDSVLALFGVPSNLTNHSFQAVQAAVSITDELAILNEHRREAGRPPFDIGIGVNTGEMIAGNLGSRDRLEYTVIGDCVNGAKRLSDLNTKEEQAFYSIFVSGSCMSNVPTTPDDWVVEDLKEIQVNGRENPIQTFAIIPLGGSTS